MQDILETLLSRRVIPYFAGSLIVLWALKVYLNYRRILKFIEYHPGRRQALRSSGHLSNLLPGIPWISLGPGWAMKYKHSFFAQSGWDVISFIGILNGSVDFIVADPLAVKEITMARNRFPKPTGDYKVLSFFGKNILITEGDEWKLHRKITAPVFSEQNNKLVWNETIRIMLDMFDSWGTNNAEVAIDHGVDITIPIALLTICVAGFGRRISWKDDNVVPAGHKLSFKDAIQAVSAYVHIKLIAPKWAYSYSKFLTNVQLAFDELQLYMQEMINERSTSVVKEERFDLFSALLDAAQGDEEVAKLTDQELIGNIFIFLIAGHETTAHTVCFCMGLLALEQEEQEKMYQQIMSLVPHGQLPSYDLMNALTYPLAVFYETLRLYPSVNYIPKICAEDTPIPALRPDGTKGTIMVPKGVKVQLNTPGLHFNPRYWPDPEAFNPSRFFGDWNRDAFLPFSAGPRACLGRRFAETEAVATLTMLLLRYKIELKNPEQYEGLSHAQKRAKLLANQPRLTVTPTSVPLVFKRR